MILYQLSYIKALIKNCQVDSHMCSLLPDSNLANLKHTAELYSVFTGVELVQIHEIELEGPVFAEIMIYLKIQDNSEKLQKEGLV
jgi:hypothetical protein